MNEVRAKAWETRRAKYGPRGHAGTYSRCSCQQSAPVRDPSVDSWAPIEWEDGYPMDEEFSAFAGEPLDFRKAAAFLLRELPSAAANCCAWCQVREGVDCVERPCKLIEFSTGGWSGAESLIGLINRRIDMRHFMLSWRRGGHYVFEIPLRFVEPQDAPDHHHERTV